MKPSLHVITRAVPTPLITACMVHLLHHAEVTNAADVLLSVQGDKIIPPAELSRYRLALNLHNAKLPEYCGFNCLDWEIANGEKWHTATIHHMLEQVDAGPIAYECIIPIWDDDRAESLYYRSINSAIAVIGKLLFDLSHGRDVPRIEQVGLRRYYGRYEKPVR